MNAAIASGDFCGDSGAQDIRDILVSFPDEIQESFVRDFARLD